MSLVKNSIIYTLGRILPQAVGFLLLPLYTSYLSTSEYGIVESMYTLTMVLTIFFSMATERSMFRIYYDYDSLEEKKKFVGNSFLVILFFTIVFTLILFLFPSLISLTFESIPFNPYYSYSILTALVMSFSFIPQTLYQVEESPFKFFLLTASTFLFSIGFILYFLLVKEQGAVGLVKGRFFGSLLMLPVYMIIIVKSSIFKIDKEILKNILKFSLPMVPTLLSAWILNMSNRVFIEKYFSLNEVGIFSLSYKISSITTLVLGSLFTAFNPIFYRLANKKEQVKVKKELTNIVYLISLFVIYICFVCAFLSKELMEIFFSGEYLKANKILLLLILSVLFIQLAGLYNLMVYQHKKSVWIMYVSIIGALASIGFNFLLVPKYGLIGAAVASILTSLLILIVKYFFAKKSYYLQLPIGKISFWIFVATIIVAIDSNLNYNIYLLVVIKLILVGAFSTIVYLRNKEKLKLLLKQ